MVVLCAVGMACVGDLKCPCTDPTFTHRENIDGKDGDDVLLEVETDNQGHRVELWCMNTNSQGNPAPAFEWFVVTQVGGVTKREKVGQCHFPRGQNSSKKTLDGVDVFPTSVIRDNEGVYIITYDAFNDGEWLSWNPDRNWDGDHDDYHYKWVIADGTTSVTVEQTENMRTLASAVLDPVAPGEILAVCDISNYLEMPRDETDVMRAAVFDETEAEMYDELLAMYMASARALQRTRLTVSYEKLWTDLTELSFFISCLPDGWYMSDFSLASDGFAGIAVNSTLPSDACFSFWTEAGFAAAGVDFEGLIASEFDWDLDIVGGVFPVTVTIPVKFARIGGGIRYHAPWNFDPFTPYVEFGAGAFYTCGDVTSLHVPDIEGGVEALIYAEASLNCYVRFSIATSISLRVIPHLEATIAVNGFLVGCPWDSMELQYGCSAGISYRF